MMRPGRVGLDLVSPGSLRQHWAASWRLSALPLPPGRWLGLLFAMSPEVLSAALLGLLPGAPPSPVPGMRLEM